jgi:Arc/MetJ-type ribon-helix-helix transcriptional regulator
MKLSVSLPDDDVAFIDEYATEHGVDSRSGVVHRAVSLLRAIELGEAYEAAWSDWESTEAEVWETTAGDGLPRAAS